MRHLPIEMRGARGEQPAAEQALVRRARTGDRAAFDELVRLHFGPLYALLFRMLQNHEDAEDLAQESFVRAWHSLPSYREEAQFGTWVGRIGVHLAVEHHRKRGRGLALLNRIDERDDGETGSAIGVVAPPAESAAESGRGELVAALSRALDKLPPRLRAAIVLRTLEEREYGDIARLLGVRPATARTHVMQARKLLVRWLAPWIDGGGGGR